MLNSDGNNIQNHRISYCYFFPDTPPDYTWYQTSQDISIQFTVPEDIQSKDIYLTLSGTRIDFGVKNQAELLKGDLCGEVDTEGCIWTMEGKR